VIIYVKHLHLQYSACLLWGVTVVLNNNNQSIILLLLPIKQQPCADEAGVTIWIWQKWTLVPFPLTECCPVLSSHASNICVICYIILFTTTKPCTNWFQYEDSILRHDNGTVCNLIPKFGSKGQRAKMSKMNSWTLPPKPWCGYPLMQQWNSKELNPPIHHYKNHKICRVKHLSYLPLCKTLFHCSKFFFNTTVDSKALIMKLLFVCAA